MGALERRLQTDYHGVHGNVAIAVAIAVATAVATAKT